MRLARDSDREGILEVVAASLGREHADDVERLWEWRWRDCPHLPKPGYYGGVSVWRDQILASVSWMPAGLVSGGQPYSAHWGVDASVHAGRLKTMIRCARAERGKDRSRRVRPSVIQDLLTDEIAPQLQIAKGLTARMQTVAVRIGTLEGTGSSYLMRNLSVTPRVRRFAGKALAPAVAWLPNRLAARFAGGLRGAELQEGEFDRSFDELFDEVGGEYPIISLRDSRTLNWRYRHHPFLDYTTVVYRQGGRLRGYAVITTIEKRGRRRGRVVDLLTRPGDEETAVRVLTEALRELLRRGVAQVDSYVWGEEHRSPYRRLGFKSRSAATPLFVVGHLDEGLYITTGDGDGS